MSNTEKLKAELQLLEIIEASSLDKKDFFLMQWQDKEVIIISPKLRNAISVLYPDVKWVREDAISMDVWKMIEDSIMTLKPKR